MNKQPFESVQSKSGKDALWNIFAAATKAVISQNEPDIFLEALIMVLRQIKKENLKVNEVVKHGSDKGKTCLWQAAKLVELGFAEPMVYITKQYLVTELNWDAKNKSGVSALQLLFNALLNAIKTKNKDQTTLLNDLIKRIVSECPNLDFRNLFLLATKLSKKGFGDITYLILKSEQDINSFNWDSPKHHSKQSKENESVNNPHGESSQPPSKPLLEKEHVRKPTPLFKNWASKPEKEIQAPAKLSNSSPQITYDDLLTGLPELDKRQLTPSEIDAIAHDIIMWDSFIISQIDLVDKSKFNDAINKHNKLVNWLHVVILKIRHLPYGQDNAAFAIFIKNLVSIRNKLDSQQRYSAALDITYLVLNTNTVTKMISKFMINNNKDKEWHKENFTVYTRKHERGGNGPDIQHPNAAIKFFQQKSEKKPITPYFATLTQLRDAYSQGSNPEEHIANLSLFVNRVKSSLTEESAHGERSAFTQNLERVPHVDAVVIEDLYDFNSKNWIQPTNSEYKSPLNDLIKSKKEAESTEPPINSKSGESSSEGNPESSPETAESTKIKRSKSRKHKKSQAKDESKSPDAKSGQEKKSPTFSSKVEYIDHTGSKSPISRVKSEAPSKVPLKDENESETRTESSPTI